MIALLVLLTALHPQIGRAQQPRLAVMDFRAGGGIGAEEARSLTGMLRTAIHETGAFTLINREDMEAIAKNHEIELVFCDDDACLLKMGSLLGAQKVVAGDIGLVVDEFVVNARLIDIGGDALVNERVATRRSAQSALQLQRAMKEIASELAGRPASSLPDETGRSDRKQFLGQILEVDDDSALLDVGRWDGVSRGTILDVLAPVDGSSSDAGFRSNGARLEIVEVFGNSSRARRVDSRANRPIAAGNQVRAWRVPRSVTLEGIAGFLGPVMSPRMDFDEWKYVDDDAGLDHVTMAGKRTLEGKLVGGSFGICFWRIWQLHFRGGLSWMEVEDRSIHNEYFDENGTSVRTYTESPLQVGGYFYVGSAVRAWIREGLHWTLGSEVEVLYLHSPQRYPPDPVQFESNTDPKESEVFGVTAPWGTCALRFPIRIRPSQRLGFVFSPGVAITLGGDLTATSVGMQLGPTLDW